MQQQRWVGAEVEAALSRKLSPHDDRERLPIYPVFLPGAVPGELPVFLESIQSVDWQPDNSLLPDGLLAVLRQQAQPGDAQPVLKGEPYRGLSYFREQDADRFFGRHEEVLAALQKLGYADDQPPETDTPPPRSRYYRWLQIHASSGAGKSSLVRAGLLPKIRQGALWRRTGYSDWLILEPMMPGEKPLTMLAEKLARAFKHSSQDMGDWLQKLSDPKKPEALSHVLRSRVENEQAVLLVVDQFEELFTQSDSKDPTGFEQKQFDRLLAAALADPDCPFFLISTIRSDFLDRFEYLPELLSFYNTIKSDYLLPTVTESGLRELIIAPARLSGIQVGDDLVEVIVRDTRGEPGALPLVESALAELWNYAHMQNETQLSKAYYEQHNGVVGMLAKQADALIDGLGDKGRKGALNLLLALTRINEGGRHTRRRLLRDDAVHEAGGGQRGEKIVQALAGEREQNSKQAVRPLRLIVTGKENATSYVELVHELLLRASEQTDEASNPIGYWPTLFKYVHDNRDRDSLRQQLQVDTHRWYHRKGGSRYFGLAGFSKLRQYRHLRLREKSNERIYLQWSYRKIGAQFILLLGLLGVLVESAWWATKYNLPFGYALIKPLWTTNLHQSLPKMIDIPAGTFEMGCKVGRDVIEGMEGCPHDELPLHKVSLDSDFSMGQYEVTFIEYDYYLWHQSKLDEALLPNDENWGRFNRPVINVSKEQAGDYAKWLSYKIGQYCRLPSESEWEYAARAGSNTAYAWGNALGKNNATCDGCGSQWDKKKTVSVGSFAPNRFGLYDMHGNVEEMVQDCPSPSYEAFLEDGSPRDNDECGAIAVRGGSFDKSVAPSIVSISSLGSLSTGSVALRSASRDFSLIDRFKTIGFRVVCLAVTDY